MVNPNCVRHLDVMEDFPIQLRLENVQTEILVNKSIESTNGKKFKIGRDSGRSKLT